MDSGARGGGEEKGNPWLAPMTCALQGAWPQALQQGCLQAHHPPHEDWCTACPLQRGEKPPWKVLFVCQQGEYTWWCGQVQRALATVDEGEVWLLLVFRTISAFAFYCSQRKDLCLLYVCTSTKAVPVSGQWPHEPLFVPTLMLLQDKQKVHVDPLSTRSPSLQPPITGWC